VTGRFLYLMLPAVLPGLCATGTSFGESLSPSGQLLVVASAETRGQIAPCNCPALPLGGLPRRASLLRDVESTVAHHVFVELGEVFPAAADPADLPLWARTMGAAYGRMGYDVVVLGDEDASLGPEVLRTFREAFMRERPLGFVVSDSGGGGFQTVRLRKGDLDILCVVLWADCDVEALRPVLEENGDPADLTLGILHGSLLNAQDLAETLPPMDILLTADGAHLEELLWVGSTPIAGPGTQGRRLAFLRFPESAPGPPAAYLLVDVGPQIESDPAMSDLLSLLPAGE